ncbi:restriction endonuclease subunit S [Labrys monachus]|uniref:Type I restriction enzyme S subunit n=1 Tax=Labrys monachus TaxID=217067 RepID=A0ABU0F8N5_9HYPH|nr:restriction endonuclease subunit S [Labrys monachus]MDQ0390722.1 type I restriction enzyme S subunit [Labrys monachus]
MTRLRFLTRLNPSKTEAGELAGYGNVTFAPMDALADGLGGLDTSLERPADELGDGSYSYFAEGDLLLAKVTPCFENGKKALVTNLPNRIGFATSEVHVIRPDRRKVDPNYLRYLLSSEAFRAAGIASMTGAGGLRRISDDAIKDFQLPITDLATQKAIAAFLDRETARIEKLIAKKERQAAVLAEREEATFLGVVTAQSPEGSRKNSGVEWIGSIPAHWSAPKFTHVARQETGHTPSRKEESYWVPEECVIPWFSLADVWQIRDGGRIYVHETAEKISALGMENSAARLLPADTVILSRTASVGFPAILSVPMATTQDFAGWICGHRVRPKFLYYVLRSMKPVFRRLMMGSTHQTIYMPDIRTFRLPLPPLDQQDAIVQQLDQLTGAFRGAARKITESVERLREYRAALITAAVAGQIDIHEKLQAVTSTLDRGRARLVVGAEIIHRLPDDPKRARVKMHKITYLAETHLGIDALRGNYLREAAGPLDRALREETERSLEAAGYYRANQTDGTGTAVTYTPLAKAGQHKTELATLLGPKAEALRNLIAMLADLDRRATEAVTTLYAVWNDALIDGETPDDAAIINGVLHEWHTEKGEKFTAADLTTWLEWIRRHNLIPRGQGPRTTPTMTPRLL